jgi:7-carboxy-7-deazaguanine synthase
MKICEIYPAISGEGSSTGRVCTIVRTVGCNLRCLYCDSQYAYEGGTEIATKDVLDVILKYGIKTVLFTGGEPLLEEKIASNFLRAMLENQIVTYVETNGSIDIRPFKLLAHMVMDVKTPSSGMHEKMEWNNMSYIGPMDEIKFVVSNREDYDYAKQVVEKYKLFNSTSNIFVSPVWTDDKKFFQELSSWMIQDRSEARLMVQQHKVIWGSVKRSV